MLSSTFKHWKKKSNKKRFAFSNLEFFNLLFDGSQVGAHGRHVTQFDHGVVQIVKHALKKRVMSFIHPIHLSIHPSTHPLSIHPLIRPFMSLSDSI